MEDVVAVVPDTVDVVDGLGEAAGLVPAGVGLHELLEAVVVELLVLHVEVLVLLHVGLVLERELAPRPVAMKMGGLLIAERTVMRSAVVAASKPQEAFPLDGIVLPVVVEVHLDVAGADVDLVALGIDDTVIVGLLLVVLTSRKLISAIVCGGDSPEPILEGFVHFLMPL